MTDFFKDFPFLPIEQPVQTDIQIVGPGIVWNECHRLMNFDQRW